MLYSFGRFLLPHLPLDRDDTMVGIRDEVALQYYRLDRVHTGAIGVAEGEPQWLGVPRPRPGDLRDRAGKAGGVLAGRGHSTGVIVRRAERPSGMVTAREPVEGSRQPCASTISSSTTATS